MSFRTPRQRLADIIEAIDKIRRYTSELDFNAFSADSRTVDAVVRNLEVIGEAAKHIPPLPGYAAAEWKRIGGMRDRLAHDYAGTSVPLVWETIKIRLDMLRAAATTEITRLAAEEDKESS